MNCQYTSSPLADGSLMGHFDILAGGKIRGERPSAHEPDTDAVSG